MTILTITGPTCAGKTTLEAELQSRGLGRVVSHTTRPMRDGEVNGGAYHFVTPAEMAVLDMNGQLVESVAFGGYSYAITAESLDVAWLRGKNVVIVVEPHGAAQIHAFCKARQIKSHSVWVDCNPKIQASRWMERFQGDVGGMGAQSFATYAGRLGMMLGEEQSWRQAVAQNDIGGYDLQLDSGRSTPRMMATTVLEFLA
jgi:guanylate kinase